MAVDMSGLIEDLLAETRVLTAMLAAEGTGWDTPTPAEGWLVRDQVSHLAYFDEAATEAVTDPGRFRAGREEALSDVEEFTARVVARYRVLSGAELLAWWQGARAAMVDAMGGLDPSTRVPWYGPDMSVASALTARIMETWAHGQDIADALGARRPPTSALRQVAHIGVRTLPNSYLARGATPPETPVRVELTGPAGDGWVWGPPDAADVVRGPALDFCLVVTQRRHLDDTAVEVRGPVAAEWMSIAQAFAGPPGAGRRPGQFPRPSG
jgi:uncharacterized protein (TIGR03084 family)